MIGRTVAQYRIVEQLGRGGMGVVYRAEDTHLKRTVALKFLLPNTLGGDEERTRFLHEARAAAALNHPNICTVYAIDEHEGEPYIAMELVEGRSLASLIADGPLKLDRATDIAVQIAQGLHEAHTRGVVHRDIKPENIMVTDSGRVKIMDFGLAAATDQTRITREGTTVGTVAYMSPEQTRGERVDGRSDIWSLGAVLYEMVTGRRPFEGGHAQALMYQIVNDDPEPPTAVRTGVPVDLERIVMRALEKHPEDRYQHADDLASDLGRLGRASESSGSRATPSPQPVVRPTSSRRRTLAVVIAVVVVAVAYLFVRPLMRGEQVVASPKPIAVIGFENLSGDSQYDYLRRAIPNLLITSLEQSRYLQVTTWERMRDLVEQLGRDDVDEIDKDLGFELCRLDGIDVVVTGSFVKAGNTFVTDVKVLDVQSKDLIASASARGEGVESILDSQVDELSENIARGVGLSRRRIETSQRPVKEVTTTSMEAYNYYLRGVEEYEKWYYDDAHRFLQRAVDMDTTFAMAYLYLASATGYLRDIPSRDRLYEKAMEYAEHATERERLYIQARYALVIEEDNEAYRRVLNELVRKYPKEKRAYYYLSANVYGRGRYAEAIEYARKCLVLDPEYPLALNEIAYANIGMGRYEEAVRYLERYAAASPGDANPLDSMADLYFRMGDLEEALVRYRDAVEVKPDFYGSIRNAASVCAVMGEYDSALVWMDRYLDRAPSLGLKMSGYAFRSVYRFLTGQVDAAFADVDRMDEIVAADNGIEAAAPLFLRGNYLYGTGRFEAADSVFLEWGRVYKRTAPGISNQIGWWVEIYRALVYARQGRVADARDMAARAEADRLQVPLAQRRFQAGHFIMMGEVLLAEGKYDEAIELVTDSLDVVMPRISSEFELIVHNFPLEADVVARAYIAKGDLDAAAGEYRRLIVFDPDGKSRRFRNPIYHYRLGKVYEDMGRLDEATAQYRRFLDDWRHADADLGPYVDACKRLDAIQAEDGHASRSPGSVE